VGSWVAGEYLRDVNVMKGWVWSGVMYVCVLYEMCTIIGEIWRIDGIPCGVLSSEMCCVYNSMFPLAFTVLNHWYHSKQRIFSARVRDIPASQSPMYCGGAQTYACLLHQASNTRCTLSIPTYIQHV
jgi:hypothetical protein